ncbi:hypothetical protein SSP531S_06110 [Streptomyces spongiicola]|uniref:Uncharacterized protein n=1 Tax=Streptomyces spongiicola TaxID=1690221 RepID=A0A388SRL5_9ACTN|nr:hypothetical protein [Streptomyces spongiicola]GBP99216.1 hypothetical protein SSP531S_06110 [Streptomyces spongiicola]
MPEGGGPEGVPVARPEGEGTGAVPGEADAGNRKPAGPVAPEDALGILVGPPGETR